MTEEDESGNPNYDPLTQIRNLWLKKGRSEQEFNELAIPLEHKILHVYPGLSTNLMRQSTAMWIQNKSDWHYLESLKDLLSNVYFSFQRVF